MRLSEYIQLDNRLLFLLLLILPSVMFRFTPSHASGYFEPELRVVHASPNLPAVDVYVDGYLYYPARSFGTTSNYTSFPAGEHEIRLIPATMSPDVRPLQQTTITIEDDRRYNLLLTDLFPQHELQLFEEPNSPTLIEQAWVSLTHASPDLPLVDVCLNGQPDCFVRKLSFKNMATVELPIGQYDFEIRLSDTNETVLTFTPPTLNEGQAHSYVILGQVDGRHPLQLLDSIVEVGSGEIGGGGDSPIPSPPSTLASEIEEP
ncbi:DUF4397 domain-containing protein, partial [Anaerolineales bacterium HSG6]|nr:DUF4397 domain-containing protein [Anaerolineales bacterium HSG6]